MFGTKAFETRKQSVTARWRKSGRAEYTMPPAGYTVNLQRAAGNEAFQRMLKAESVGRIVFSENSRNLERSVGNHIQREPSEEKAVDKVKQYLDDGTKAVAYTREKLRLGMANFWNDLNDPRNVKRAQMGYELYAKDKEGNENEILGGYGALGATIVPELILILERLLEMPEDNRIRSAIEEARQRGDHKEILRLQQLAIERTAALGERLRFGNCAEHASICYLYLRDKTKSRPLEMLLRSDHAFVALGRLPVNSDDPHRWGDSTVICDAYYDEVYLLENGVLHSQQTGANQNQGRLEE